MVEKSNVVTEQVWQLPAHKVNSVFCLPCICTNLGHW